MLTARRLYLYAVSTIGLALSLAGLTTLLRLLLDQLGFAPVGPALVLPAADRAREDLSRALALASVGLPLWLSHTWYAERLASGFDAAAASERQSTVRAAYYALVLAATLWFGAISAVDVLRETLRNVAGVHGDDYADIPGSLATSVVALLAWGYLAWARARDLRAGPMRGAAAWITRLEGYGAVLVGFIAVSFAVSDLIGNILSVLVGRAPVGGGTDWWVAPALASVALVAVGGPIWIAHWRYADGLIAEDSPWAPGERLSRVRVACLLAIAGISVAMIIAAVASTVGSVLAWAVGVAPSDDAARLVEHVIGPPLAVTPFMAAWWWHRQRAVAEAVRFGGQTRERSVRRLADLLASVIGLAVASGAAGWALGIGLDAAFGGTRTVGSSETAWRGDISQFVGYVLGATPVWLVAWYRLQARMSTAPAVEAASAARRGYLYLVGGVALVAAAVSLALVLYQMIRAVAGLPTGSMVSDVSAPIGIGMVACAVLAYHIAVFLGDARAREGAGAAARGETATAAVDVEDVEIMGPEGTDFEALNVAIRAWLPGGFTLRVTGHHGARGLS